ncbi:hypothetical protein ULMS_17020 [Patiriisocius marinistellae]|uniref:Uncharacterized protein n=1 Tax=Patiriisocius marinistellae TaxID=2494560 RepID=A0A5J4FYD7_9FLAO|nr:hypothetical protein [Patiriisocius marinistellae]GEQ86194.1 hypothetical protein ULMS_17020 [Patiriisocius marinistellae]
MKFLKQTLLLTSLIIFSSCESEIIEQNSVNENFQSNITNSTRSVEIGEVLVVWEEGISERRKEVKRQDLIEREFLFTWDICPENLNMEIWTYNLMHRGKPKVKTDSDSDYEKWLPNENCPE